MCANCVCIKKSIPKSVSDKGKSQQTQSVHLTGAYVRCSGQPGEMLQALSRLLNSLFSNLQTTVLKQLQHYCLG